MPANHSPVGYLPRIASHGVSGTQPGQAIAFSPGGAPPRSRKRVLPGVGTAGRLGGHASRYVTGLPAPQPLALDMARPAYAQDGDKRRKRKRRKARVKPRGLFARLVDSLRSSNGRR